MVKRDTWPDAEIAAIAERQQTMIGRGQLLELGVSARSITRAVQRGRLHRVHRGVYSLVPLRARPPLAAEYAALLACGPRAVLSHETAARLHGLSVHGRLISVHVTLVDAQRRSRRRDITLHRTHTMPATERHMLHGLPVTSVARTVIDLSPTLTERRREILVDEALHHTSRTKLTEALRRHPGRPGVPALTALLDPARPSSLTWSEIEERLLILFRRAGVPPPETNVELSPRYRPDMLWRGQRVILEYVSDEWHSGPRSARNDDARDNDLTASGFQILRITRRHVPEQTLAWVVRALALADLHDGRMQ